MEEVAERLVALGFVIVKVHPNAIEYVVPTGETMVAIDADYWRKLVGEMVETQVKAITADIERAVAHG